MRTPDGRTLLLGRARQLATVHDCLDRAREGRGDVLIVSGEAGVGKSHLLRQAALDASISGFVVHAATADEMTQTRPFGPWVDALQITASSPDESRRALAVLLRAAMLASAGELGSAAHVVIEDVVDLVEQLAADTPRMIVIEDLHWADHETLLTARAVARSAAHLPLLLVMSYRSGGLSPIAQRLCRDVIGTEVARELPLDQLDQGTARRLARELAGDAVWPGLNEQVGAAGGNPMLIELLVSAKGRLSESDLRLAVREHVRQRSWVLGDEVVDTLNYAALLGRRFSPELLAEVLGRTPVEVADALQRGVEQQLLVSAGMELAFRHDLIRDALSDELHPAIRANMHTAIGRALARTGARSAEVARHVALGAPRGDQEALLLLRRAAVQYRRLAPAVTVDLLTMAESLADERLPDQIQLELLWALAATGGTGMCVKRAERLLAAGLKPATAAAVHACLGLIQQRANDLDGARIRFDTATSLAEEAGDVQAAYLADAASTRAFMGDVAGARSLAAEALRTARTSTHDDGARCEALCALTWAAHSSGDVALALAHAREAVAVEDHGHAGLDGGNPMSRLGLGLALLDGGTVDDAEKVLREGRSRAEHAGSAAQLPWYQWALALCAYVRGAWQDATTEAETGLVQATDFGTDVARDRLGVIASRLVTHSTAAGTSENDPVATWYAAAPDRWIISWSFLLPAAVRGRAGPLKDPDTVMQSLSATNLSSHGALGNCVARWCRALLTDDGEQVLEVAHELATTNRAGLAAPAFEDAGDVLARRRNSTKAADAYAAALELFASAGAAADVARIAQSTRRVALTPAVRPRRPAAGWASLTASEVEVARRVAEGLRNRDIAEQLVISRHTVESHLKHIFTKLDVQSRVELALLGRRHLER